MPRAFTLFTLAAALTAAASAPADARGGSIGVLGGGVHFGGGKHFGGHFSFGKGPRFVGGGGHFSFGRSPRIHIGGSFFSGTHFRRRSFGGSIFLGTPVYYTPYIYAYAPLSLYSPFRYPYGYGLPYYGGYSSPTYVERQVYVERPIVVERASPRRVIVGREADDDYVYEWRSDARRRQERGPEEAPQPRREDPETERQPEPAIEREADRVRFETRPGGGLQVRWTGSPARVESVTFVLLDRDSRTLEMDQVTEEPFTTVFHKLSGATAVRVTVRYSDGVRQSVAVPLPERGPVSEPGHSRTAPREGVLASVDPYALYRSVD